MTHNANTVEERIERAAETVGSVWPIHSFVTANPLAGFEEQPFHQAVAEAEQLFGGRGYPHHSVFRRAWDAGRIDRDVLVAELASYGIDEDPDDLLAEMAAAESNRGDSSVVETDTVDRVLSKWLVAFLDEGQAKWPMPNRERGFYAAWRKLAPYDSNIPCDRPSELPETPTAALESVLENIPEERWVDVFEHHLAALPGWTGFIKQRTSSDTDKWQDAYPITLTDYLAVRLLLVDLLDAPVEPDNTFQKRERDDTPQVRDEEPPLPEIWLTAWEKSYRQRLLDDLNTSADENETALEMETETGDSDRPMAQFVFCIDTRSEVIRRHIEQTGPYETHGYAGFFGIPMRYQPYGSNVEIDACPPIVDAQHHITEHPDSQRQDVAASHDRWTKLAKTGRKHLKTLKTNVAAAFTFVEGAGSAYGAAMATRTLLPSAVYDAIDTFDDLVPRPAEFCTPTLDQHSDGSDATNASLPQGMSLGERVAYAETAFELMGWEEFGRFVVFTGHTSQTSNNPFDSSLDCGACAGNSGGPNARVLAAICNDDTVRSALQDRGYDIPDDTVFLAAEHNTTTDEITLFDSDEPENHQKDLERLRDDLAEARANAAAERAESLTGSDVDDPVGEVERRAADWAETRPEWGLAGNASFVIGRRDLTAGVDLDGRAFLHSYDWTTDPEGEALEGILTGPLVVTQWINNQYYFASVDNAVYGSGSKTTQNPVGNVGILQGNGGDLMTGLPLQSLYADDEQLYHQPLRLTAVIQAPVDQVSEILSRHENLLRLVDNGWIRLTVMDPTEDEVLHYAGNLEWESTSSEAPTSSESLGVVQDTTADD